MTTYRVGTHHGVTINREGDGHRCDRPGHGSGRTCPRHGAVS